MTKEDRIRKISQLRNAQKGLGGWHVFHFILTMLTGFLWGIVWIIHAVSRSNKNKAFENRAKEEELILQHMSE